ncbi:MAG: putative quorum-sensing-regulated virulence factor [Chlamydiales bacterium]
MSLLKEIRFVCLDCEFTGLDLEKDRIIEVAAIRFTFSGIIDVFDQMIDPEHPITAEAQAVHNISNEMLKGRPTCKKILPSFFQFIGNDLIVGHAIKGDLDMLEKEAMRASIPFPLQLSNCIDTLRLARHYGDSPNNSLSMLARHFNVPSEKSHRALDDVNMNIEVFKKLVARYKTLEQIEKILARPIEMKYMPLGKHKGRPFSEIPLQYLLWAARMDFDQDLLFSIHKEIKKRKQGGNFAAATNPFSEL